MKKTFLTSLLLIAFLWFSQSIFAQTDSTIIDEASFSEIVLSEASEEATLSAELATESAVASPAAKVEEKIQQKTETDITQTQGAVKSRLAQFLDENPIGPISATNLVQHAIRRAVDSGVPANMLVLMLMFPVVASLIAVSRHVIGLQGFGIYIPAVLAVAFLSTGIGVGLLLFGAILISGIIGSKFIHFFKLQYLPRTALLIWFVSLSIFAILLLSPYLVGMVNIVAVGIFPILVLILLSENFIGAQSGVSRSRLFELTLETLFLSVSSALFMRMNVVQEFVILHPEITILLVAGLDIAVGKYTGLRLSEYFRFKPIIDDEE